MTSQLSDPDADGLNNILEFGSGLDPRSAENLPPVEVLHGTAPGEAILKFRRRALPRGLSVMIEKSTDLQLWQSCRAEDIETISVEKTGDWGVEVVTARLLIDPIAPAPMRYLRLRVEVGD